MVAHTACHGTKPSELFARYSAGFWRIQSEEEARSKSGSRKAGISAGETTEEPRRHTSKVPSSTALSTGRTGSKKTLGFLPLAQPGGGGGLGECRAVLELCKRQPKHFQTPAPTSLPSEGSQQGEVATPRLGLTQEASAAGGVVRKPCRSRL